jgi:hypothetical protein
VAAQLVGELERRIMSLVTSTVSGRRPVTFVVLSHRSAMTWFENLTGCSEDSPAQVRMDLDVDGPRLHCRRNGRSWLCGELETPTLAELRDRVRSLSRKPRAISVREVVANVQHLHADKSNAKAVFQVASQFNLLEMVAPEVTPERGVGIYERDRTQGPACAIAAGAGTIFRNYFALVNGRVGQSADNQIDCLAGVGALVGNTDQRLWQMVNGYALPSAAGLTEIDQKLKAIDDPGRDRLRQALQIGLQWDTQVTLDGSSHVVSQAYCSALPAAYTEHPSELWARFATLVLEASYEATICAAIINADRTRNDQLYLTLLGGGAFGNELAWITGAIRYALSKYSDCGLDVVIVSYGRSKPCVQQLATEFAGQ